jgi:hypothetical protein
MRIDAVEPHGYRLTPVKEAPFMPDRKESSAPAEEGLAGRPDIVNVSGMTMLEILQSGDPELVTAVRQLLAEHRTQPVTASWASFLDPGVRGFDHPQPS